MLTGWRGMRSGLARRQGRAQRRPGSKVGRLRETLPLEGRDVEVVGGREWRDARDMAEAADQAEDGLLKPAETLRRRRINVLVPVSKVTLGIRTPASVTRASSGAAQLLRPTTLASPHCALRPALTLRLLGIFDVVRLITCTIRLRRGRCSPGHRAGGARGQCGGNEKGVSRKSRVAYAHIELCICNGRAPRPPTTLCAPRPTADH